MSTLFISDLHLDASRPEITRLFLDFLKYDAPHAEALYILGDFFEAWVGDDDDSELGKIVTQGLRELSDKNVPVFFMRGNRDFLIGQDFAKRADLQILPDPCVLELYGKPTLLMHGDLLCSDDTAYQAFRLQVRSDAWQTQFLSQPLAARQAFAAQARAASKQHQNGLMNEQQENIMDVTQTTVLAQMKRYGVSRLIHGHTHRPAIHQFHIEDSASQRIVLGDWYSQGSVLRVDADGDFLSTI
ncbi:MAG: UDP-2,3-diacylglucosamine diphosphatase [Arenimonas sp.]